MRPFPMCVVLDPWNDMKLRCHNIYTVYIHIHCASRTMWKNPWKTDFDVQGRSHGLNIDTANDEQAVVKDFVVGFGKIWRGWLPPTVWSASFESHFWGPYPEPAQNPPQKLFRTLASNLSRNLLKPAELYCIGQQQQQQQVKTKEGSSL